MPDYVNLMFNAISKSTLDALFNEWRNALNSLYTDDYCNPAYLQGLRNSKNTYIAVCTEKGYAPIACTITVK